jgi:SAM-dependent methyltransferase
MPAVRIGGRELVLPQLRRKSEPKADPVDALRETWSRYAREWDERPDLNLGVETLGEEWGGPAFAERIVTEVAAPYLGPGVDVLELGCGGGKFSAHLRPRTRRLVCADISADMLARTRAHVGDGPDVEYLQLSGRNFAGVPDRSVDVVFSYDVLLHLQPQNVFAYLLDARRILRPGGIFMLHAINLASGGGSYHFEVQYVQDTWSRPFEDPHRLGHIYYMSEDQLRSLAALARFGVDRLVTEWPPPGDPLYGITSGRDTFGFLRREDGILEQDGVRLVKTPDGGLFALAAGRRREFPMTEIFDAAGFRSEDVEPITQAELAAIPAGDPVSRWEL